MKNTHVCVSRCVETSANEKKQASSRGRKHPTATRSPLCVFILLVSPFFLLLLFFFTSLAFISLIGLTGQSGSSTSLSPGFKQRVLTVGSLLGGATVDAILENGPPRRLIKGSQQSQEGSSTSLPIPFRQEITSQHD